MLWRKSQQHSISTCKSVVVDVTKWTNGRAKPGPRTTFTTDLLGISSEVILEWAQLGINPSSKAVMLVTDLIRFG